MMWHIPVGIQFYLCENPGQEDRRLAVVNEQITWNSLDKLSRRIGKDSSLNDDQSCKTVLDTTLKGKDGAEEDDDGTETWNKMSIRGTLHHSRNVQSYLHISQFATSHCRQPISQVCTIETYEHVHRRDRMTGTCPLFRRSLLGILIP